MAQSFMFRTHFPPCHYSPRRCLGSRVGSDLNMNFDIRRRCLRRLNNLCGLPTPPQTFPSAICPSFCHTTLTPNRLFLWINLCSLLKVQRSKSYWSCAHELNNTTGLPILRCGSFIVKKMTLLDKREG